MASMVRDLPRVLVLWYAITLHYKVVLLIYNLSEFITQTDV